MQYKTLGSKLLQSSKAGKAASQLGFIFMIAQSTTLLLFLNTKDRKSGSRLSQVKITCSSLSSMISSLYQSLLALFMYHLIKN